MRRFIDIAFCDTEYLVWLVRPLEDRCQANAVGISDKYLVEHIACNKRYKIIATMFVEFIKDIIKQQNGFYAIMSCKILILRQLKCNDKRLTLSLRTHTLHGLFVKQKLHIVLMNTTRGITKHQISLTSFDKSLIKIVPLKSGDIVYRDTLCVR